MTVQAISVENLTKSYKDNDILKNVQFTIPQGNIFTLLGSNGAGKSTIVKILTTLLRPDEGTIKICGYDLITQPEKVRSLISLTGQFAAVDELLTGWENLWIIGELRHLPNKSEQAAKLLDLFCLTDVANKPVSIYSGGMRRRLDIAMSMIGHSPVVFLDEPTAGLDPQNRLAMWNIINSMASSGTTVFLTTQYLEEAEYLADQIAILHEGRIIAEGTANELKEKLPQGIVHLQFKHESDLKKALALLHAYTVRTDNNRYAIDIETDGSAKQFADILNCLNRKSVEIVKFAPKQPTLEDAFLTLIGEKKGE